MALIDKEDEDKKESSEESFITNFSNQLLAFYVIATTLHYYSHVCQIKYFYWTKCIKCLVNFLLGTK